LCQMFTPELPSMDQPLGRYFAAQKPMMS
jgi:hypothetical protein